MKLSIAISTLAVTSAGAFTFVAQPSAKTSTALNVVPDD
jgi:hypothetical protein